MGINMGKSRALKWGLFAVFCLLLLIMLVHAFVTSSAPAPAPEPTPEAEPGPLSGWSVCLDAGHGGYDGGARGAASGTAEKELNLDVALRLAALLREQGAQVILTRETDTALADEGPSRKRRDLQYRVDCAAEADVFLSIHMNEYRSESQSGPQVFYRKGAEGSRLLAGTLQEAMNAGLSPARPRSANTGEYYLLENLEIPAVLVECGFLSNRGEEAKLLAAPYRQQVAQSLLDGLLCYRQLCQNLANAR